MKTTRSTAEPVGAPGAGRNADASISLSIAPALRPSLRLPLDLPIELRTMLLECLLPVSPFLVRDKEPGRRFPVAHAMRDLRAVSETCKELNALVSRLRLRPDFAPVFELASRVEFEFKKKTEAARQICITRYNADPLVSTGSPYRLRAQLLDARQMQSAFQELVEYGNQVRELNLYIAQGFTPPPGTLRAALVGCASLRRLCLVTNGTLSGGLIDEISASPALQSLTLESGSLAGDFLSRLAQGLLAQRLHSLELSARALAVADLQALAAAAREFPGLRFLSISNATLTLEHCIALAGTLPSFPQVQELCLGKHSGRVSSAGMSELLTALVEQGKLTRLGIYNLDDVQGATSLFSVLSEYPRLQELAYGGPLLKDGIVQPWTLLSTPSSLGSLILDACALDEMQLDALGRAMEANAVRELHIANQSFTNPGIKSLAKAIRTSKSLVCLSFEDCEIGSRQGRELGRAVAACGSLLVLRLLYKKDADGAAETLSAVVEQAKKSESLLQFDVGEVSKGWNVMQETLRRNRLR